MANMEKEEQENKQEKMPAFVEYLSDPNTPYNCWFIVGDTQEKIGGVNLNLMAHSVVFRKMLHESPLAETGPVLIKDVQPATFKHFLRFVNGYFNVEHLSLEEAVDLFCVAEKYLVSELKRALGKLLATRLTVENIYPLMSKVECFQDDLVKSALEKIIQENTAELLSKEEHLKLNQFGIVKIVSQPCLAVSEEELWSFLLRWAKHQAEENQEENLRDILEEPLRYMRLCTLGAETFCKEVAVKGVLTDQEIVSIVKTVGGQTNCEESPSICYTIEPRALSQSSFEFLSLEDLSKTYPAKHTVEFHKDFNHYYGNNCSSSYMYLTTETKEIELISAGLDPISHSFRCAPKGLTFQLECRVSVTRITDYENDTSKEQEKKYVFAMKPQYDVAFSIPFAGKITLLPLNKYYIKFNFSRDIKHRLTKHNQTINSPRLVMSWKEKEKSSTHFTSLNYNTL